MIFSDLPNGNTLANPNALNNKQVGMISYRQTWTALQPTEPGGGITNNPGDASWQWGFFDSALAQATAFNLPCFFRVLVQANNSPSWVQTQSQQYITVTGLNVNVYWDTFYQAAVIALIQAMASRYASNPLVKIFACNIAADHSGDWGMPHATSQGNTDTPPNWQMTTSVVCPAYNASVTVIPVAGSVVYPGWYVFRNSFGWFKVASITGTPTNPTSAVLFNPGTSGNASSGVIGAGGVFQVSDIGTLAGPIYGYTTARFETAIQNLIVAVKNAWTTQQYSHEVGRNGLLDPNLGNQPAYAYNASTQMGQYGYANVATGKFALAKNTLSGKNSFPPVALSQQDGNDLYLPAQTLAGSTNTSGTTGVIPAASALNGQFLWQTFDPTGLYLPNTTGPSGKPYYANAGVPYSNPLPVFQYIVSLARAYGVLVLETYEQDILGGMLSQLNDYSTVPEIPQFQMTGRFISPPTGV